MTHNDQVMLRTGQGHVESARRHNEAELVRATTRHYDHITFSALRSNSRTSAGSHDPERRDHDGRSLKQLNKSQKGHLKRVYS
jgi:hypothetical protein